MRLRDPNAGAAGGGLHPEIAPVPLPLEPPGGVVELVEVCLPDGVLLDATALREMADKGGLPAGYKVISPEEEKAIHAQATLKAAEGEVKKEILPPDPHQSLRSKVASTFKEFVGVKKARTLVGFYKLKGERYMLCSDQTLWIQHHGGWFPLEADNLPPIPQETP